MSTSHEHEALVAQFFEQASMEDPELYAEVCERHVVLTDRQMATRTETELVISQFARHHARLAFHCLFYSDSSGFEGDYWEGGAGLWPSSAKQ